MAPLGRVDLEVQLGEVTLAFLREQAEERGPEGVPSAAEASQARRRPMAVGSGSVRAVMRIDKVSP